MKHLSTAFVICTLVAGVTMSSPCYIVSDDQYHCLELLQESSNPQEMKHIDLFRHFQQKHGKRYQDDREFIKRYRAFADNYDFVTTHNTNTENTFILSVDGPHADLSHLEYIQLLNVIDKRSMSKDAEGLQLLRSSASEHPIAGKDIVQDIDWQQKGAVGIARDQGQIGSCYAFSSVGAIESRAAIERGYLVQLSPQQVVDCSMSNEHDNGGLPDNVFRDLQHSFALATEEEYPYTASYNGVCKTNKGHVNVLEYTDVQPYSVNSLKSAVMSGPVSIAVQADSREFQLYQSGVFNSPTCFKGELDHAVLAIGFKDDYLIVRNSWSQHWGVDGNIYIKLDNSNVCGILSMASYPSKLAFSDQPKFLDSLIQF